MPFVVIFPQGYIQDVPAWQFFLGMFMIPAMLVINIFLSAMVARHVGAGKAGDYFIGAIAGIAGTFIPWIYVINDSLPLMLFLSFAISIGLALVMGSVWAIVKRARMGSKENRQ